MLTLLLMSILVSVYSIKMGLDEADVGDTVETAWSFLFALLVAMWALADARASKANASFGYGLILFFVWPLSLIYHMAITRGIEGIHSYFGFLALYVAPNFTGLYAYAYFT